MNADYFRKLAESQTQPRKADPTILAEKIEKYLAAGKTITTIPRGASGVVLAPMGIKRTGFKGAKK
jgi:hypothetical protein